MPIYDNTGFQPIAALVPGEPGYSFGSFDSKQATCKFLITQVQIATNVATVTGKVVEGNIPVAGQLVSIRGSVTGAGEFNVTNIAISSVSIDVNTGIGTIVFALTGSNVGPSADGGVALIKVAEQSETVTTATPVTGRQFAIPTVIPAPQQGRSITWNTVLTGVTVISINLEVAEADIDAQYTAIDNSTKIAGETRTITLPTTANFVRMRVVSVTTTGTIIGKIQI